MGLLNWLRKMFKDKKEPKPIILTDKEQKILKHYGVICLNPNTAPTLVMTEKYAKHQGIPKKDWNNSAFMWEGWKVPIRVLTKELARVYN